VKDEPTLDPDNGPSEKPVMRVTTGSLSVPEGFAPDTDGREHQAIDRIAAALVAGAIMFILFIAWLISRT